MYMDISYICVLTNMLVWSTCRILSRLNTTLRLLLIRRVYLACAVCMAGRYSSCTQTILALHLAVNTAGSSACSRAPRNVSAPRAASCPDVRLTFSCHSSIPDTLNILFTSESLSHIHGKLSISSATTNFNAIFLLGENFSCLACYIYKARYAMQPNTNTLIYNTEQCCY